MKWVSAKMIFFLSLSLCVSAAAQDWQSKVPGELLERASSGPVSFLIMLDQQADLSFARTIRDKAQKGAWVMKELQRVADESQKPILEALNQMDVPHQPFWIVNMVLAEGDVDLVANLAQRQEVSRLVENKAIVQDLPPAEEEAFLGSTVSWGVERINAPEVWAMGYTGQGVIIGGQDTGYAWNHDALRRQYLGWNGTAVDHNYTWHDSIHSGGGICGPDSPEPCDDGSHGTHTMGTMVGDDGSGNQTGVAPGARWIGCRNMDRGNGTPATYSECFQWFIAPTDLQGNGADPSRAPHVINNSWGCPDVEGCTDPNILKAVVDNTRAAGIVVVTAAGNTGSGCQSIDTAAAIYDASFTVGATTSSDSIAGFSSRGPVSIDGSFRLKPDISAPGTGIRSTVPSGFGNSSGTSMAAPHVAGLVALIISADPSLAGDVDRIEEIIRNSALGLTSTQDCGSFPGNVIPNPVFGWGRIRADKAIEEVLAASMPTCADYPSMLATWPNPVMGFPDTNANQVLDIMDLIPLANCPLTP